MVPWEHNLEGYQCATAMEINGSEFGLKIFIKIDRKLNESDRKVFFHVREAIESGLQKESLRLNPETHKEASLERAEILNLFTTPIFVEEIPNGYCSRYCCAFKPWFVVTTAAGRIKIGWRKSVIHIEWTDSVIKRTAEEIFPKEEAWPGYETTQFDKTIHAHGYEPARRYIQRLTEEIAR